MRARVQVPVRVYAAQLHFINAMNAMRNCVMDTSKHNVVNLHENHGCHMDFISVRLSYIELVRARRKKNE